LDNQFVFGLGVKRILQEARDLANDPSTDYVASPLEVRIIIPIDLKRSQCAENRKISL
jgi:hypothetical protein